MIAARKILQSQYMIVLPYIVSSKVEKLVGRKTVNKKEMTKLESSKYYPMVVKKYQNEKIIRQILSTIATIISSDFRIVDFKDLSLNGRLIETVPDMIIEEYLMYTLLI
jgi:Trk K+ transport system NAD-binding subunit